MVRGLPALGSKEAKRRAPILRVSLFYRQVKSVEVSMMIIFSYLQKKD